MRECCRNFYRAAATALVAVSPIQGYAAVNSDAFLNQPLPPGLKLDPISVPAPNGKGRNVTVPMLKVTSFQQGLAMLAQMTGKKIVPLAGLLKWPGEDTEVSWNSALGVQNVNVKEMIDRLCQMLGLHWEFEPEHDDIALARSWKRDDPRSSTELARILAQTQPAVWSKLPQNVLNQVGGRDVRLDDWRTAFDALISKPENFSFAGTVRLYFETHGDVELSRGFPVMPLLVKKIKDVDGMPEILVINGQMPMGNKDQPGDFAYYLFDEQGKFIKGGVCAMGEEWEGQIVRAFVTGDHEVTIDVGWGSFAMGVDHAHFRLENRDLVLKGSTDSNGRERNAEDSRKDFGYPLNGGSWAC